MKPILALLAWLLLVAAAPAIRQGPIELCADATATRCTPIRLDRLRLDGRETHLAFTVDVPPEALPLSRPLMVWITAMASSEVSWNGVPIGRNGRPAATPADEEPGRFIASIPVPSELVRPGANRVSLRLSAHHLWLPVVRAVHYVEVGPYETPRLPGLGQYLPALLTLGALAAALVYFLVAAFDRGDRKAGLVAGIAGTAILQLAVEVARTFIAYTYPWHLARVAVIAGLAAITALLAARYAARRFAPEWTGRVTALTAAGVTASVVLIPWYDPKAMAAILCGLLALGVCAARGLRARRPGAAAALAGALLMVGLLAWQLTVFLDQAYYLGVAAFLVALVAEQVSTLRQARRHRDDEAERAAALEARLQRAAEAGEAIVQLRNGNRTSRVAESDIRYLRAADDYCDAVLTDGRVLLVTTTLARLLETLPDRFLRVHKSFAVNRRHVARVGPRPGGGRQLDVGDGTVIPVGRSYAAAAAALADRP